ncbi:cyclin-domain-containing protein [Pilobolus umbonatus]|nr:cyclin-domain-containing protein [Pilobolus umbonatus]
MRRFDLVHYPAIDTIKIVTYLLERIIKTNDKLHQPSRHKSPYACFYARAIPHIDIQSYLTRILKYCPCANECFLSLLVYFDRMSRNSSGLRIDSYNIHRLIITGIMISSKFFSDVFYTNARYAKVRELVNRVFCVCTQLLTQVGGLPILELNALEIQFLKLNEFQLNVQVEELQQYGDQLLWHFIRENYKKKEDIVYDYHKSDEYKKEDYYIIPYSTDHSPTYNHKHNNHLNNHPSSQHKIASSHLLDQPDTYTRC